jgi:hypothetical protein
MSRRFVLAFGVIVVELSTVSECLGVLLHRRHERREDLGRHTLDDPEAIDEGVEAGVVGECVFNQRTCEHFHCRTALLLSFRSGDVSADGHGPRQDVDCIEPSLFLGEKTADVGRAGQGSFDSNHGILHVEPQISSDDLSSFAHRTTEAL